MVKKLLTVAHEDVMPMLNHFGKIYHTYFGFDNSNETYVSNEKEDELVFWGDYANHEQKEEEETYFTLDVGEVKKDALQATPYSVVRLTLPQDYWRRLDEVEWYNSPSKWWAALDGPKIHLEYLKARGFVKVIKPHYQIEIRKEDKGTPITVEDILFAARGLAADDTRCVADSGFKVLKYQDGVLELEPQTDNWST